MIITAAGMEVDVSEEVREAHARAAAVVVLESSVLAQGLAFPDNLVAARACEAEIRSAGAVPAVTAVIRGRVRCGLSTEEVRALAEAPDRPWKVGARDLAPAVLQRATGGTTVSASCAIAGALGLPVLATGGIGGVHRGDGWDVSEDLGALARYRGAVVCAGAKAVLDLPRTLESLEALGVPVVGWNASEFPAFFAAASGLSLEHRVDTAALAAELLRTHRDVLGRPGAVLFTLPPPAEVALEAEEVERHVAEALALAAQQGVRGKSVTPFLLGQLALATGGRSVRANLALLAQNAAAAAALAVAYGAATSG